MFENIIKNVHNRHPLIHCITNYVSINDCANIVLALDCGYFDEAHMMKEFKSYAGLTLEQYRKMQRRI